MSTDVSTSPEVYEGPVTSDAIFGVSRMLVYRLVSIVAVFVAWEIAGRVPISVAFPTFSATMAALWEMTLDGRIKDALSILALQRVALMSQK